MGQRAGGPNIVLIVLDALRADATEPYGAPAGSSPALADLARAGLAVSDVRATASWTLPSHIAMFTGQLARGLGLGQSPEQTPQGAAPVVREQRDRLLAEVLRRAGYVTKGVSTNVWAGPRSGFGAGFEEYIELDASRHRELGRSIAGRLVWNWDGLRARGDDGARQAEGVFARWLSERDERPFFWFVNLVECHSPYLPPRPYDGLSAIGRLRAADEAQRYLTFDSILRTWLGVAAVPPDALERMRRLYAGSVRYVDAWVGRLLESLARVRALDDTLVIVCSDHGENFGDGGLMTHGLSLDERLLRVPLIAAGPGHDELGGTLSLAELPVRLASAIDLDDHPFPDGLFEGVAVAQWDPFELDEARLDELVRSWGLDAEAVRRLRTPLTCAVSGHFKLMRDGDDELLFDLEADPLEAAPLREQGAIAARAGDALVPLRAALDDPRVQARGAVTAAADVVSAEEALEIEQKMRLLGYL